MAPAAPQTTDDQITIPIHAGFKVVVTAMTRSKAELRAYISLWEKKTDARPLQSFTFQGTGEGVPMTEYKARSPPPQAAKWDAATDNAFLTVEIKVKRGAEYVATRQTPAITSEKKPDTQNPEHFLVSQFLSEDTKDDHDFNDCIVTVLQYK
ncbi:hypothetical protein M422DRAFT_43272 [Sphaerobolus stellatus SS14]|nr:hypothetical protein M422DRAFT_43272 [Sphaerobolus stellatus SS14]